MDAEKIKPSDHARLEERAADAQPVDPPRLLSQNERIEAYIDRARRGDQTVLPVLKRILKLNPCLWQARFNLVSLVEQSWLHKIAGMDLALSESIRLRVEQIKEELAGPTPSPLERILAERIVACWLGVQHAELSEATGDADGSKLALARMRRLDLANKRFLAATKALAIARRLTNGLKIELQHTGAPQQEPTVRGRLRKIFDEDKRVENAALVSP